MIAQGTDVFSKVLMTEVFIPGEYILSFVPLQLILLKLSDNLLEWINYWWLQGEEVPLTPEDWFKKGQEITGQFTKS